MNFVQHQNYLDKFENGSSQIYRFERQIYHLIYVLKDLIISFEKISQRLLLFSSNRDTCSTNGIFYASKI